MTILVLHLFFKYTEDLDSQQKPPLFPPGWLDHCGGLTQPARQRSSGQKLRSFSTFFFVCFFIAYILLVNTSPNEPVQQSLKKGNQHNSTLHFWFLLRLPSQTSASTERFCAFERVAGAEMTREPVEYTMNTNKMCFFPLSNNLCTYKPWFC